MLRCLNRMHEVVKDAYVTGEVLLNDENIYMPQIDPVRIRRRIGMVFQKPNPFPMMSVYENVIAGFKLNRGTPKNVNFDEVVERSLRSAALWDEVKDKLDVSGAALSGGQQQRLCIARVDCGRAGSAADGRTMLGARPDLDAQDRRPDERIGQALHDCAGHPQHAASGPRFGDDRVYAGGRAANRCS